MEQSPEERPLLFHFTNADDTYVFFGAVAAIARFCYDLIHNVHAFYHFSEYGIVSVQVGGAPYCTIYIALLLGVFLAGAPGEIIQFIIREFFPHHDVEL